MNLQFWFSVFETDIRLADAILFYAKDRFSVDLFSSDIRAFCFIVSTLVLPCRSFWLIILRRKKLIKNKRSATNNRNRNLINEKRNRIKCICAISTGEISTNFEFIVIDCWLFTCQRTMHIAHLIRISNESFKWKQNTNYVIWVFVWM